MTDTPCPFCNPRADKVFYENTHVLGLWDAFPVSPGHALLVTRRHVPLWFDATADEQRELLVAIACARTAIEKEYKPAGYNIGINSGAAAGQTIPHLHVHLIPRYVGDVDDPCGGVRHVIPGRGNYLVDPLRELPWIGKAPHARAMIRGSTDDPLLPHLIAYLDRAVSVDIAVAFTLETGVRLVEGYLRDVLDRGGQLRFVTGDYLAVTEPDALLRLLDLDKDVHLRVFESKGTSFHPKAYVIRDDRGEGAAFVGSSNLSESALRRGVEWNYRVITSREGAGFGDVVAAFDALFAHPSTVPITSEWVEEYRRRRGRSVIVESGIEGELPPPPPQPHAVQQEALAALVETRHEGNVAGLVVLATGLGKTWLSAFDSCRPSFSRVLFIAHREEILGQAMRTFRSIRPDAILGHYNGTEKRPEAEVLFASIQTLSRQAHLERFARDEFDYVVVDEFHHASAPTYRRVIDYFQPKFLLGLTATPERTDGGDLLALCGDNLVYRCDLVEGIRRGLLSPFEYFGVPDEVDYTNIPWRSNRFDEEELTRALATQARAENALEQYRERAGERTLAFCVSQRHADFMANYFRNSGVRAVAVHAGSTSAPRTHSLDQLRDGELDVIFAVDMFNEGVDLPNMDTVMMLRPTESQIIWLQQFGRGLRFQPDKRLKVIDYIGNHRSFLVKPRALFQLGPGDREVAYALDRLESGTMELPPGCSVTYDLEAKNILQALIRIPQRGEALKAHYRDFVERNGIRPTAVEAYNDGYDPKSMRRGYGSWFGFVDAMGGLSDDEREAFQQLRTFLAALGITPMTKSFKMLALLAMISEGAFPGRIHIDQLCAGFAQIARRYAALRAEVGNAIDDPAELRRLVVENPIAAWVDGRGMGGVSYFEFDGEHFSTRVALDQRLGEAARTLVREIAEWRLAMYVRRASALSGPLRIQCRVSHANGRPIIFLPNRDRQGGIPEGWRDVEVNGVPYQAFFAKIAVNKITRSGSDKNVLPEVLRGWFGPRAGEPGTTFSVVFEHRGRGYVLKPASESPEPTGPQLWHSYKRAEVPKLFGFEFRGMEAQSGIVERPGLLIFFVTLHKDGMQEAHRYEDTFLSPTEFKWQSQNRNKRDSALGRKIAEHREMGIHVHLFVRAKAKMGGVAQPFVYCGELEFQRWDGDKPITVWWELGQAVPGSIIGKLEAKSW